ncbi:hypothetical protein [Sporosarcina sp. E16_8]|uniref:hypothetical protein n=1 Tax=Sporosarcina sp. E16_8 TaxID=2789295 RepID=UPI001A9246D1|nr:hypothetical protein [Sporosarcina sp. E16_8]MBO0588557.1 hypothetical protein [Sporosarcina sp. E16_8]
MEIRIHFLDCGASVGVDGGGNSICTMIGVEKEVTESIEQIIKDTAVEDGCFYAGELGSGHFLKTIHNGSDILENSKFDYGFEDVAKKQK